MPNAKIARNIYKLQNEIVWALNNTHIFLEQAQPLLIDAKVSFELSNSKSKRKYFVPSPIGRTKFAKRTDLELKKIYDYYISSGLFEAFLTHSFSQFEYFLADVLLEVFIEYPQKLSQKIPNCPTCPDVSIQDVIRVDNTDDLFMRIVDQHISNVFRQRPEIYMNYISEIVGVRKDPCFKNYYEVAATRDLIVHNDLCVNELYLEKSKTKARGNIGDILHVDKSYYYDSLANFKKVSGVIKRDVERKFGRKQEQD